MDLSEPPEGGNAKRDYPLSCHWRPVEPEAFDPLCLPPAKSGRLALARTQILTEAFVVNRGHPDEYISYSRRQAWWSARTNWRYWPDTYRYSTVVPAVDQLAALGIIEHERKEPGSYGKRQSRFRLSPDVLDLLNERPPALIHNPNETIILRDRDGRLIDYPESRRSSRMRRNVEQINEMLTSVSLGLRGGVILDGDRIEDGQSIIGAAHSGVYRVFNGTWGEGGRFYGAWYQNILSGSRADITINGNETVEHDFPQLHPTMLYAEAGTPMDGDPYDLHGRWPRKLVKQAFNTLVNAYSGMAAVRSIAQRIGGERAYAKTRALVCELERKHNRIAHLFYTGAGLRLQRRDSDMAERILLKLADEGVVCLPIHDGFRVANRDGGNLRELMQVEMQNIGQNSQAVSKTSPKNVPQYGDRPWWRLVSPLDADVVGPRPRFKLDPAGMPQYVGSNPARLLSTGCMMERT